MMLGKTIDRVGVVAIVLISGLGYVGGVKPLLAQQTSRLLAERDVASTKRTLAEREAEALEAELSVTRLDEKVATYREGFHASENVNERIGELTELASVVGVSLDTIQPGETLDAGGTRSLAITITGRGKPDKLASLLSEIRRLFPDVGARSISISASGDAEASLSAELVWFSGGTDDADREDGAASES